ncbi:MAG TPA: hypothetical protein VEB03_01440 [Candidatus Nanoarchaeia archaeon]|nr:hypothetical protein [Candidatus Nanoarchaeia archaeon]
MHLQQVTQPGFMERLTVTLASSLVQRILPKTRLEIRRSTDGELTLVVLERFGDHFEVTDDSAKILFHDAMFGLRERMLERFSQIPVKESISIPLSNLPTPIAFVGPIETSEIALRVTSGERETLCNCEVRRTNDYRGFVHPSGFAITISRAMQRDGVFVHYINVEIDKASTSQLPAFPDLWNFLAQCEPDGILHIGDLKLPVTGVGALAACGFFARYLQTVYPLHSWPDGTWLLRDALQEETLNTLGWLAGLRHLDDQFAGAGLANERLSEFAEESKSFQVPVCANLPRCGVVTWLKTHGTLLVNAERAIAGVCFGRVRGFNIQTQSDRFAKSVYPAIAIHRDWPLIELTPEGFRETSENDLGYDLEID